MWQNFSSGERFHPFVITRQDGNNSTSKNRIRNRNRNRKYKKREERENTKETSNNQERKHTREYADFRRFSARRGVEQRPKQTRRCSNSSYKPDQYKHNKGYDYTHLSTDSCGISTPTPFLGRAVKIWYVVSILNSRGDVKRHTYNFYFLPPSFSLLSMKAGVPSGNETKRRFLVWQPASAFQEMFYYMLCVYTFGINFFRTYTPYNTQITLGKCLV